MNRYEMKIAGERGYYVEALTRNDATRTARQMASDGEFGTFARENCYRPVSVVSGPRDAGTVSPVKLVKKAAAQNEERFDAILDGTVIGEVSSHYRARHITLGGGSDKCWSYRRNGGRTAPAASKTSARDQLLREHQAQA